MGCGEFQFLAPRSGYLKIKNKKHLLQQLIMTIGAPTANREYYHRTPVYISMIYDPY